MTAASLPLRNRAAGAALFAVALILTVLAALRLGRPAPRAAAAGKALAELERLVGQEPLDPNAAWQQATRGGDQ